MQPNTTSNTTAPVPCTRCGVEETPDPLSLEQCGEPVCTDCMNRILPPAARDVEERFAAAIEANLPGMRIAPNHTSDNEPDFSNAPCDSCGSTLAGDRHDATGFRGVEEFDLRICTDCILFHANGDMPETWEG